MTENIPSKTVRLRLAPPTLRLLAKLSSKTWMSRNNVIRFAIAKLAESEGVARGRVARR